MANQEQVELLKQGVEVWNQWREEHPGAEVDLRGANLRGANFRNANFSETDIRGANFTNAILRDANFTRAKAGLQKRWIIIQLAIAFLLSLTLGLITSFMLFCLKVIFMPENVERYTLLPGIVLITIFAIFAISSVRQDQMAETFRTGAGQIAGILGSVTLYTVNSICLSILIAFSIAISNVTGSAIFSIIVSNTIPTKYSATFGVFILSACAVLVRQAFDEKKENTAPVRVIAVNFAALGGTSFRGADLTGSMFSDAILNSTSFANSRKQETILTHVCWRNARKLNRAQVENSILKDRRVRELLVTGEGNNQNLENANLRGVNLTRAKLNSAILKYADLSKAILSHSDLQHANLTQAQAIGTDFTGAYLTGTCIEAWNIDSTTNLQDVDAQFVYLLESGRERRPSSGEFAPGEFTKLFQEALNTVDLIFRDGIDWQAFFKSFQELRSRYSDENLSIQAIEKKSEGAFVVRLEVPAEADKAEIEHQAKQLYETELERLEAQYQQQLQLKDVEIDGYRRENTNLLGIVNLLSGRSINSIAIAGSQSMGDRNIHMGSGNYNERIDGNYIQGNYINMSQDLTQAAQQIQDLLQQLQNQGVTVEAAQQQVSTEMAKQAETDPTLMGKMVLWSKAMANKASETTVSEAAKMVLTLALKAAGIPLP